MGGTQTVVDSRGNRYVDDPNRPMIEPSAAFLAKQAEREQKTADAQRMITANAQMNKLGPAGTMMARMLSGQGGEMMNNPVMLAAAGMGGAAQAALQQQKNQSEGTRGIQALMAAALQGGMDPSELGQLAPILAAQVPGGGQVQVAAASPGNPFRRSENPQGYEAYEGVKKNQLTPAVAAKFDEIRKKTNLGMFGGLQRWTKINVNKVIDAIANSSEFNTLPNARELAIQWFYGPNGPAANAVQDFYDIRKPDDENARP